MTSGVVARPVPAVVVASRVGGGGVRDTTIPKKNLNGRLHYCPSLRKILIDIQEDEEMQSCSLIAIH